MSLKPKVVVGEKPTHVTLPVDVILPDGRAASIEMRYIYRTRTEYGDLIDRRIAEARAADQAAKEAAKAGPSAGMVSAYSEGEHQRQVRDATAQHILDIADGWNLDMPFNLSSVRELCDELPGAAAAVVEKYRFALIEGRRGN